MMASVGSGGETPSATSRGTSQAPSQTCLSGDWEPIDLPRWIVLSLLGLAVVAVVGALSFAGGDVSPRVAAGARGMGGRSLAAVAGAARFAVARTSEQGIGCDRLRSGPFVYHWPVKPFERQHPVRGYFGDPRTLGLERLGTDRSGSPGSFTFHTGIDISAPPDTPVYPVVSGLAHVPSRDLVTVTTGSGRTFQYFHIKPAVQPGQPVIAYRTVLGRVKPNWKHVHLTEIDHFRAHNPLDPGHLEPYHDHTIPSVAGLWFRTANGLELDSRHLHGLVTIAADAEDLPAIPVPGHWYDFPVTPALVNWRLSTGSHSILRRTVTDVRHTEPPSRDFWRVYAAGTYQNFPDFAHHLYWHHRGRYLFNLTPTPLNTRQLANGTYHLAVATADTCGNRATLTQTITIKNPIAGSPPGGQGLLALGPNNAHETRVRRASRGRNHPA